MAKPYSMDLRERAVLRVVRGESVRGIAQALSVSPSSVVKWSQRFRATGSAAPRKMGGNRRPKIVGGHRLWLLKRISTAGFTLRGLVAELAVPSISGAAGSSATATAPTGCSGACGVTEAFASASGAVPPCCSSVNVVVTPGGGFAPENHERPGHRSGRDREGWGGSVVI